MEKVKVVPDANILVSSVFWSGNPYTIIQKGINNEIELFTSSTILSEVRRALIRDFNIHVQEVDDILDSFHLFLTVIEPIEKIDAISADPEDNHILECAISCDAQYIVSGDSHLLSLREFRGIKIVLAADFLKL